VVRPYSQRIRSRMVAQLRRAGLWVSPDHVVPVRATDRQAVTATLAFGNAVLLVPYHARRDAAGAISDGISFLRALHRTLDDLPHRVIMPVSLFGAAGLEVALSSTELPLDRVLLVTEGELDDHALAWRIRSHVDRPASVSPPAA